MAAIETNGLSKFYGKNRGIIDINLTVNEGEIFGFIGPNGAGKSTTIRTLLNFVFPSSGSAAIFGMDCVKESAAIKKSIGYVPGEVNYYNQMRVKELIDYAASFYKHTDKPYINGLYEQFEVDPGKRVGDLSSGNKKKVAILQALLHKPRLLILDEPTNGLDPLMQSRLFEALSTVNKGGATIFFSSHNLMDVQRICGRIAIIKEGRIVEVKKVEELLEFFRRRIIIKSKDKIEILLQSLNVQKFRKTQDTFEFIYDNSIDRLIKSLAQYTINDIRIEELTLEDKFMHYYTDGGSRK